MRAEKIAHHDYFLTDNNQYAQVVSVLPIDAPSKVYNLSLKQHHNFFISQTSVLVHNVVPVLIAVPAAVEAGKLVVAAGIAAGVACYAGLSWIRDRLLTKRYQHVHHSNDAQAPGKPTEKEGFKPAKGWDGKKIRHPKTGQHGYPDKKGNVWVPTGPGGATPGTTGKAHGGPHWDVVDKDGKGYDNVYPGGKIRTGRGR